VSRSRGALLHFATPGRRFFPNEIADRRSLSEGLQYKQESSVAGTTTKLMTFAEFERTPDPPGGFRQELRHGELVNVPPPKIEHSRVQWRIRRLLESAAGAAGIVDKEIGFRVRDQEWRIVDVAFVSQARWDSAQGYLDGAPEIVVEVLSPSNSATEMIERERLCLENGCLEFWLVDPELQLVRISTPDGRAVTYTSGQDIPLPLLNGGRLGVDAIFTSAES
jgi:Uma2 family endonuclease